MQKNDFTVLKNRIYSEQQMQYFQYCPINFFSAGVLMMLHRCGLLTWINSLCCNVDFPLLHRTSQQSAYVVRFLSWILLHILLLWLCPLVNLFHFIQLPNGHVEFPLSFSSTHLFLSPSLSLYLTPSRYFSFVVFVSLLNPNFTSCLVEPPPTEVAGYGNTLMLFLSWVTY